ncbi:MAG: hypothetical protein ACI4MF_00990 [Candidatus Faecivicinus sp.]
MRWWIKLILGVAVIAALVWLAVRIGSFTLDFLSINGGDSGARDPMFAEEAETVTKPPELSDVEGVSRFQDNSANWDTSVQTPVDQTADELQQEARGE